MYVVFCLLVRVCLIIIIVTAFLSIQTARQPYSTQVWFDGMWDGVFVKEIPPPYPTQDYSKDECVHRGILNSTKKSNKQNRPGHPILFFLSLSFPFTLPHSFISFRLLFTIFFTTLSKLDSSVTASKPTHLHSHSFLSRPPSFSPSSNSGLAWLYNYNHQLKYTVSQWVLSHTQPPSTTTTLLKWSTTSS